MSEALIFIFTDRAFESRLFVLTRAHFGEKLLVIIYVRYVGGGHGGRARWKHVR